MGYTCKGFLEKTHGNYVCFMGHSHSSQIHGPFLIAFGKLDQTMRTEHHDTIIGKID